MTFVSGRMKIIGQSPVTDAWEIKQLIVVTQKYSACGDLRKVF
jgi:hypothetical protein